MNNNRNGQKCDKAIGFRGYIRTIRTLYIEPVKTLFITCFCLFLICSIADCLNRGEIREQIRYQLLDTTNTTNNVRWSTDMLNKRINLVQNNIVKYTLCLSTVVLMTPTTNQREYELPKNLITIYSVGFENNTTTGTYKKLVGYSLWGLDRDYPTWDISLAGLPLRYYKRGNYIGFDPKPASTYSRNNAIRLTFWYYPPDMVSDTDVPFDNNYNLTIYHDLIISGVVIICKEARMDFSTDSRQEYAAYLSLMKEQVRSEPDKKQDIIY